MSWQTSKEGRAPPRAVEEDRCAPLLHALHELNDEHVCARTTCSTQSVSRTMTPAVNELDIAATELGIDLAEERKKKRGESAECRGGANLNSEQIE